MTDQQFFEQFGQKVQDGLALWDSPSVAIGVIKDGKVVLCEGYGVRDVEQKLPATRETLYQIGSCSKAFTSALVAIMVDQGKLDWDTPIRKYVPEVTLYDAFTSENCTLRDLLSHRTGIPRHEYSWYRTDFTRKELVEHMKYLEPNQPFRTKFQYNNYGYILAGYIVEKLTGKTYEECLDEYLFRPLGMDRSCCFIDDIEQNPDHAEPYDRPEGGDGMHGLKKIPFYRASREDKATGTGAPFAAAGAIDSCAEDMLKWVRLHLQGGKTPDGRQIISQAAMDEMHKPSMILQAPLDMPMEETQFCCYGMGWFTEVFRGHKILQHGGNIDGFSGFTSFVPDLNLGVVAYTNLNSSCLHYALARTIIDHYLGIEDGDWVKRYHDFVAERHGDTQKVMERFTGKQVEGTHPSHALADFTGTYERDGYSPCVIRMQDETLIMEFLDRPNTLRHFHYDTFVTTDIVGELPPGIPVHFHTAEVGGGIDSLAMPLVTEAGGALVRFAKKN